MSSRTSLLPWALLLVCLTFVAGAIADEKDTKATAQKPSPAAIRTWVSNLASAKFEEREAALAALIEAGKPAIAPLAESVMSGDPEVAWRAATALEAIGLEGDEAILSEIKTRMERTKGTPNRDLAQILSTLTQRWAQMQQTKSQTALVKLGATFPDFNGGNPTVYGGSPVFMGSYAAAPTFASSGTVVIESFSTPVPVMPTLPTPTAPAGFDPLAIPSSLERIISGMEKIEAAKAKEDDRSKDEKDEGKKSSEKTDASKDEAKKEEPKSKEKTIESASKPSEAKSEKKAESTDSKSAKSDSAKSEDSKPAEPKEPVAAGDASTGDKAPEPATVIVSDTDLVIDAASLSTTFMSPPSVGGFPMPTAAAYGAIRLDQNYHGGDSGLVHLAGLPHISMLDIQDAPLTDKAIPYIAKMPALTNVMIRGTKISPEALVKLKKARPTLSIRGQGRGILGVNANETASECIITNVRPGAPSEAAGILVGDRIIKLDGKEVTDFLSLTVLMMKREAGEEVTVTLKRGEATLEKKLTLASREELAR